VARCTPRASWPLTCSSDGALRLADSLPRQRPRTERRPSAACARRPCQRQIRDDRADVILAQLAAMLILIAWCLIVCTTAAWSMEPGSVQLLRYLTIWQNLWDTRVQCLDHKSPPLFRLDPIESCIQLPNPFL
jgi:hypothetical protein